MSHRKRQLQNPEPQVKAQPATLEAPPDPQPEPPEVSISEGLQAIIDGLDENHPAREKVIEELDDMLNPLILRPIILRTRCDLCPV